MSRRLKHKHKDTEDTKIVVCARFKPKQEDRVGKENNDTLNKTTSSITLPLHQRLTLIRISQNLKSSREALQILQNQGGWFHDKWQQTRPKENDEDETTFMEQRIDEAMTTTPRSSSSLGGGVHTIDSNSSRVILVDPIKGLREFAFDNVLPDKSTQQNTYEGSAKLLVSDLINGKNATCLAYGQTGSGKTYTMFGPTTSSGIGSHQDDLHTESEWGIIPRACHEIFHAIQYRRIKLGIDAKLSLSYVEIFGEKVSDLLRHGAPQCGHSKVAAQRYVLDGAAETNTNSFEHMIELLKQGEKQKRVEATAMNKQSSRAHTLIILTLRQTGNMLVGDTETKNNEAKTITSKLFLADLGGSEQIKKSQADQQRTKEAVNINLGLFALKKVAAALQKKKKQYIPYADSKLTMLLSEGLGGQGNTSVVLCASQDSQHIPETIQTILLGKSVSRISNDRGHQSKVNNEERMLRSLLNDIDSSIKSCEANIHRHERWETIENRCVDNYGNVEIRKTTKPVGAETYRIELEYWLRRRAELTGTEGGDVGSSQRFDAEVEQDEHDVSPRSGLSEGEVESSQYGHIEWFNS